MLPEPVLRGIGRIAVEHGLWVISDEVYEDIWFGDTPPASVFTLPEYQGRTIANHSV